MRNAIAVVVILAGCAAPPAPPLHTEPARGIAAGGFSIALTGHLEAMHVAPIMWRYRVVDVEDPAMRISDDLAEPCFTKKSWLPNDPRELTKEQLAVARHQDGRMLDACNAHFLELRDRAFSIIGAIRDW